MTNVWSERAKWIWGGNESSPRNEWRLFRKTFPIQEKEYTQAWLDITADSRYVLFVNGQEAGRGPVRSWPAEQAYDTYDVSPYIRPGEDNTIAVMVMHFGLSTFYYLKGRGGLLAQLRMADETGTSLGCVVTDGSWRTLRHPGQDGRAPRMSCQQAFAERIDARLFDSAWKDRSYSDEAWPLAEELGVPGMEPWTTLIPRDIPPLTEETVYPIRVEALKKVRRISWNAYIDIRSQMVPDSREHANPVGFVGYLATVVRVSAGGNFTIGFPAAFVNVGTVILDGKAVAAERFYGEAPERYADIELEAGDHLLMVDVSGIDHGHGFRIGVDGEAPIELISPLSGIDGTKYSPFVGIGPFDTIEVIDHRPGRRLNMEHEEYLAVRSVSQAAELTLYADRLSPVPLGLYRDDDVFGHHVWKKASESQAVPHALQHLVTADGVPARVPFYEGADTEMIIDFGKETVGYIEFELDCAEGTIVDFYGYEYMRDEYIQHTYGLDNTLRYVARKGRQTYKSPVRRGFRYLMLTVRNARYPVHFYSVRLVQNTYPVAEIGRFHCSDALLNDIWQISRDTTKLCMEDTFVDCPAYEQAFWVGDSRNEALIGNYLFSAPALTERCLRLVPGSRNQTPLYADQVPSGWSSVIPNWTFFWVIACKEHYEQTGQTKFAKDMWPSIRYTLNHYVQHIDDNGLFNIQAWNLLDWAPIDQPNGGVVTHQNAFLVKALNSAAELALIAGHAEEADSFKHWADRLKAAMNKHLWSEDKEAYLDCIHADGRRSGIFSMQTQVAAFLCDIADGPRKEALERYLLNPPASFVQIGSPFMSFFYYEALARIGKLTHMLDDIRRNYGQMIDYEATTCWEMYPSFKENRTNPNFLTRSHCHAWSAAPAYFLGAYILGVRPQAPGWEKVLVEPNPCGLRWARGSAPLPEAGRVDVSWRADEERRQMEIEVRVPQGQQIEVKLPEGYTGTTKIIN